MTDLPDPESIPKWAKEYDNWCLWSLESERPGKPLNENKAGVSWSDPGCGYSFGEAYRIAESDSYFNGVGLVLPENAEHYGIDVDGCLRGQHEEKPKEWVPDLDPFTDAAYIEYSKSGTGLHIFAKGDVPEWWTNSHFSDDEHEGVEAYENKFFIFTGEEVSVSASEPDSVDPTAWLLKAYKEIRGRLPDTGSDEGGDEYDGDSELSKETVEDAINELDPDMGHSEWVRIGFAVHDWDAGSTGKRVFESWSRGGSKWDSAAERTIDWIWSNADRGGDVTLGTLIHKAQENGWSFPKKSTDGGATAQRPSDTISGDDPLTPGDVIAKAGYDLEDTTVGDIPNSEVAYAIAQLLEQSDRWHFRAVNDSTEVIYSYHNGVWDRDGEQRLKTVLHHAAGPANSSRLHSETCHAVRSNPLLKVNREELGAPAGTIAVQNGLLDLREQSIDELQPDHYALNRLNVEYQPGTDYDGTEWIKFLQENVRESDIPKLQEYAGYCLWHHAQPFGKAMFLLGPTDSGKGTFLEVLEHILGHENVAAQSLYELMQTRWGMAELYGKMANIRNEVTGGGLKNVQRFKELTGGGDRVSAERKGQDPFKFRVTQKFVFATNQVPSVEHAGEPFFNRLLFAKFPESVPESEQDPDLADRLKNEAPAILNWMLDGLNRLLEQEGFSNEGAVDDKREIADAFGSVVDRFAHNLLDATGDDGDKVHKGQLYDLFTEYADYIDKDAPPQQTFTTDLKNIQGIDDGQSRKVDDSSTNKPNVFKGVRVKVDNVREFGRTVPNHSYSDDNEGRSGQQRL